MAMRPPLLGGWVWGHTLPENFEIEILENTISSFLDIKVSKVDEAGTDHFWLAAGKRFISLWVNDRSTASVEVVNRLVE